MSDIVYPVALLCLCLRKVVCQLNCQLGKLVGPTTIRSSQLQPELAWPQTLQQEPGWQVGPLALLCPCLCLDFVLYSAIVSNSDRPV